MYIISPAGLLAWKFKATGQVRKQAAHHKFSSAEVLARFSFACYTRFLLFWLRRNFGLFATQTLYLLRK